jgi:hypothetical protein
MYAFQFMDATWRIAHFTNSSTPYPVDAEARRLYGRSYPTENAARQGIETLRGLLLRHPEWFVARPSTR